jgi:hypothetical protein
LQGLAPAAAEWAATAERAKAKLADYIEQAVRAIVTGETTNQPAWVQELAAELKADTPPNCMSLF